MKRLVASVNTKILENNNIYKIFEGETNLLNKLPAGTYRPEYNELTGWSLIKIPFYPNTEKVYGDLEFKANQIIDSYDNSNRNLGVLISGPKGIGKTIFAKLILEKMIKKDIPVIIVNENIPGIINFLSTIDQEIVLFLDEFEKIFVNENYMSPSEVPSQQEQFLTFLDGAFTKKQLTIAICNESDKINSYMLNRPGRFHYHIRFDYPPEKEIKNYLEDNLNKQYFNEIDTILKLSKQCNLTYDCLRALCFEVNLGRNIKEVINDLNIDSKTEYKDIYGVKESGEEVLIENNVNFAGEFIQTGCYLGDRYIPIKLFFNKIKYDDKNGYYYFDKADVNSEDVELPFVKIIVKNKNITNNNMFVLD